MIRKNSQIFILLFFTVALFALDPEILVMVPKTLSSVPVMEVNGAVIDKQKIKVDFYDDHILTMAEFVSGKVPVFMTGFSLGLTNYYASKDTVLVVTPVWGVAALLAKDPDLKTLADFTGKTILVPFAKSPLELQLTTIIKKEGLADKIKLDYSPIQQQPALLIAGKADGICIPEPLVSKLLYEKKAHTVFIFAEKWNELNKIDTGFPEVSMFVKQKFAESNKAFLKAFVQSIKEKIAFIKKNPAAISQKYKDVFNLDPVIIENGLKNVIFNIPEAKNAAAYYRAYLAATGDQNTTGDDFFFNY